MKIAFIANTNEPGQSGVGDYTLGLAYKLKELGAETLVSVLQESGRPSSMGVAELKAFQPDWVSYQFVPYAYAHRGLVNKKTLPWGRLKGRVGTHFMFHEVWIGAHRGAAWRDRLIGFLQRRGIQSVMRQLRPDVVNCSNQLYSAMLSGAGIDNSVLPLFGAIPIAEAGLDPYEEVVCSLYPGSCRQNWLVATFFGALYPSENILSALIWLQALSRQQQRRLLVVSLGHSPSAKITFETLAPSAGNPDFLVKGRLEADELSRWIRNADCGLSTTPFNIIEKSSSAIAFVEHGVPVIVIDEGAPVRGVSLPQADLAPDYWHFGDDRLNQWHDLPAKGEPQSRLERVARQFLEELEMKMKS